MSESGESGGRTERGPRWSVEQRVGFAARRLYWDGSINREDLVRRFGVSPNQATADLARLKLLYPRGFAYDTVGKRYRAAADFLPREVDAARLLTELRLIAEGQLAAAEGVLGAPPPLAIAEAPARAVDTRTLRTLLAAIAAGGAVAASYVSFQRPGVARRVLSPHALVFDGFRWHVRAHDAGDDAFKDFLIARLAAARAAGAARRGPAEDTAWNRMVPLVIGPHPGLDQHQRSVIARDYGMDRRQRLRIEVREAVLFYVRRRLGLVEGHLKRPAREQHIVLVGGK